MIKATAAVLVRRFHCGPVHINIEADAQWIDRLSGELVMFDVPFDGAAIDLRFEISQETAPAPEVRGNYLQFHRYRVDRSGDQFIMASVSGASCRFDSASRRVQVKAPSPSDDVIEEVEQFLIFSLVWGWRELGWTPLHVATIEREGRCALVCAESCGGKSTFTAACIRRGFRTLGDDKVLIEPGKVPYARSLSRSMNLDPRVSQWFPEAASISELPRYSRWSPKRKVRIEGLWPGSTRDRAVPTILLRLSRGTQTEPIVLEPLSAGEIIHALARQTVIANDRVAASATMSRIMALGGMLRGWSMRLSADVYRDGDNLKIIDELFT